MYFSIVLVVHDRYDTLTSPTALPEAIASLDDLSGQCELILVNNNDPTCCPNTSSYLRQLVGHRPATKLVETGANLGCAGGFNRGASVSNAASDALVFMSPDALLVDPHVLDRMAAVLERHPALGLAHPVSIYEDATQYNFSSAYSSHAFRARAKFRVDGAETNPPNNSAEEVREILSAVTSRPCRPIYPTLTVPLTFLAIRRSIYERLGGFDEAYLCAGENTDFTLRALNHGYPACVISNSFVFHRRLLFKYLGQAGSVDPLYVEGDRRFLERWAEKWQEDPISVYLRLKYGNIPYQLVLNPAIRTRRWARRLLSGWFDKASND